MAKNKQSKAYDIGWSAGMAFIHTIDLFYQNKTAANYIRGFLMCVKNTIERRLSIKIRIESHNSPS